MGGWFNNPYDTYRAARNGGHNILDSTKLGGEALLQSPAVKRIAGSPAFKWGSRALPFVSAGFDGYNDYQEGIKNGENELRAGIGSGLAAAADATFWTGVRTLNPITMAAGVGLDGLGWVADRGFEIFDKGDGFKPGSEGYKKAWAAEYQKNQANYNSNPTAENKQKLQESYANATGTSVPLKASDAGDTLDIYSRNVGDFLEKYMDPDSALNSRYRQLIREDEDRADHRMFRNAAFEGRFALGKGAIENYYERSRNSANDAATLARAGSYLVGGG